MEAVEDILHEVSMSRSQREGGKGEWKIVANLMKRVVKLRKTRLEQKKDVSELNQFNLID